MTGGIWRPVSDGILAPGVSASTDTILLPANLTITGPATVTLRIWSPAWSGSANNWEAFFGKAVNGEEWWCIRNGKLFGKGNSEAVGNTTLAVNIPYTVGYTVDASKYVTWWLNGRQDCAPKQGWTWDTVRILGVVSATYWMNCAIWDVRLYNRILAADEMLAIHYEPWDLCWQRRRTYFYPAYAGVAGGGNRRRRILCGAA